MEEKKEEKKMTKTQVYNVIILDRSGSMGCIRRAAIDGFNETLAGIQKAQEKFADTQEHFVSLVSFCGCETKTHFDKVPTREAHPLKPRDYEPCCTTPLFDAMGFTLTGMRKFIRSIEDVVVVVSIITDGYENASREYTGPAIKQLVEELRGEGWTFTYMGANQDAMDVAMKMSIRNARNFAYSGEGISCSMRKDTNTRMDFYSRLNEMKFSEPEANIDCCCYSQEERGEHYAKLRKRYTRLADEAFDNEEKKKD